MNRRSSINYKIAVSISLALALMVLFIIPPSSSLDLSNSTANVTISSSVLFPNQTLIIKAKFKPKLAIIQDPVGKIFKLKFYRVGKYYLSKFRPKKDIVLGKYTLIVDGIVKHFVVDYYTIDAKFNGTAIVGKVKYYFYPPKLVCYRVLDTNLKGCVAVVNGTFIIPVKSGKVLIKCGNAKTIVVVHKKSEFLRIAFDPIEKKVVLIGTDKKIKEILFKLKKVCKNLKQKKLIRKGIKLNVVNVPAENKILRLLDINKSVLKTKVIVKKLSQTKIRVEVINKTKTWYRFSVKIPKGYGVKEIVRDDGKVICNVIHVDRITGDRYVDIRWYVENGTLYFYDDPIWGYNVSLTPPQPNRSIAVELAYNGSYAGPGQISAIVYPYNSTDDSSTIASHDHAGRTEDNWANDIDINAGSKIAIRFTLNGTTYQYGNWYYYWFSLLSRYIPLFDTLGDNGNFTLINRTYVNINTAPNGVLESVIIDNFTTSGNEVNIVQKTIIRGDEKWFATIYYIKPLSGNLTNVRFFQGMDWNFNGDYRYSSCYYNSTYDVVYGHYNETSSSEIDYGGYSAYIPSSAHDVGYYTDVYSLWSLTTAGIWGNISRNALSNNSFYDGDAATVLAWDKLSLNRSEIWVIPVVWGLGTSFDDMIEEIQKGKSTLYDAGIKSIDNPINGSSFNPNVANTLYINATVALYGLVDLQNLNVTVNVTQLNGNYTYENFTFVNLSVPFNETTQVSFPLNVSSMPYGTYKVTVETHLPNDQNSTNDKKWIIIRISSFVVEPDQSKIGNAGDEVFYNLTVYNYYSAERFDINITQSTKGWMTRLYCNATLVAEDTDGDGSWDYINSSYDSNCNELPDIYIPYGKLNIIVSKVIPLNTPLGEIDYTTLDFISTSDNTIHDNVSLMTETPQPPTVHKTFYIHDSILNTTPPTSSESPISIPPNSLASWQQTPVFSEDFNVAGTIVISLWLNSSVSSTSRVVVSLFYTNGDKSYILGSQTKTLTLSIIPKFETFTITLPSQTVIPKGYYLVLRVENTQATSTIYVFHNNSYPSNVTLNTTTYIKVQKVESNKNQYIIGEKALIFANITDPIGAYDISGANITVYYPNGTLYVSDFMNLSEIDPNDPPLWKLYSYSLYLPASGTYNVTICGIESNGVTYCQNFNLSAVTPKRFNISTEIITFWQRNNLNIIITVESYINVNNVSVYWIKPRNVTVTSISGDYDANTTLNDYYSWMFYSLNAGEVKKIYINATISGEFSLADVYNIGVDPKGD